MINDFFTHPMRISFLISCVFVIFGSLLFFTPSNFVALHKFFFLSLVPVGAYYGFLMTALPDWTNYKGSLKWHCIFIFILLCFSFIACFFYLNLALWIIFISWSYIFIFSSYLIFLDKSTKHFSILLCLFGFVVLSFLYALNGDEKYLNLQLFLNCVAILLITFRISIVLGSEALKQNGDENSIFIPNAIYKNIAALSIWIYIICSLLNASDVVLGYLLLASGSAILAKLLELHYYVLLKKHFIMFYYLIQIFIASGFIWLGTCYVLSLPYHTKALHLIAISGILGSILLVFNVAGTRHSGFRMLNFPMSSKFGMILIFLATISRSFLSDFNYIFYIYLPSIFLVLAFGFYLIKFYKIFKNNEFTGD